MKAYIEYIEKIKGVEDVSEVVKTIEKISASRVHFLKKELILLENYLDIVTSTLSRISVFCNRENNFFLEKKINARENVLVIISSDRGLVGNLWHDLINKVLELEYDKIIVLGSRGYAYLLEENIDVFKVFDFSDTNINKNFSLDICKYLFDLYTQDDINKIDIIYADFISIAEHDVKIVEFLPFNFSPKVSSKKIGFPIFEQKKKDIYNALIDKYIENFFYKLILEVKLSEFSVRMLEMEHASEKAKDEIIKIKKKFNKQKRNLITQKQLEIFNVKKRYES